jgi:Core-2/I-Branching enzyme
VQLVYLILAYKRPHQVARLVDRLESANAVFLIHVDAKTDDASFFPALESTLRRDNVFLVPRVKVHWGRFGHVEATLRGIDLAFRQAPRLDYLALLTEADYPIKPPTAIERLLADRSGTCFIDHHRLPREEWHRSDGGLERIERRWFWWRGRWYCLPTRRFPFPPKRAMPLDLVPYQGTSYWWLPRDALEYVRQFLAENPRYRRFFRRVLIPDESFFQTILPNSRFRERTVRDDLRYVDWGGGGNHPAILTVADLPSLAASEALVARKFDEERDSAVLDRIDSELLGVAPTPPSRETGQSQG